MFRRRPRRRPLLRRRRPPPPPPEALPPRPPLPPGVRQALTRANRLMADGQFAEAEVNSRQASRQGREVERIPMSACALCLSMNASYLRVRCFIY